MVTRKKRASSPRSRPWFGLSLLLVPMLVGCHLFLGYEEEGAGGLGGAGGSAGAGNIGGAAGMSVTTTSMGGIGGTPSVGGGGTGGGSTCTDLDEAQFATTPATGVDEPFSETAGLLTNWGARYFTMNAAGYADSTSLVQLCPGQLRIYPGAPDNGTAGYFWHNAQTAPFVFQRITGDFAIEVDVSSDPVALDSDQYTGAGVVVRNPKTLLHWVTYTVGAASTSEGTGTTVRWRSPTSGPYQTAFQPSSSRSGRLLVCRINGTFSHHRWLDGDAGAQTEEDSATPDAEMEAVDTLEVGLSATWYQNASLGAVGVFEKVKFHAPPLTHQACADLL